MAVDVPGLSFPSPADGIDYVLPHFFGRLDDQPPDIVDPISQVPYVLQNWNITRAEIALAFRSIRVGGAPGPDGLCVFFWKDLFAALPSLFVKIVNKSFQFLCFPRPLRVASVIFIPKANKDPLLPNSLRPICLLPTIGKVREKIFFKRLSTFVMANNIISPCQFGFPEGAGCADALFLLRESCCYFGCIFGLQGVGERMSPGVCPLAYPLEPLYKQPAF